jgi:hypothetical protein
MKCGQVGCEDDAEFRYFWAPDASEQNVCRSHLQVGARLTRALNMAPLKVHRIAELEARNDVVRAALCALLCASRGATEGNPPELERLYEACDRLILEEARTLALVTEPPATTEEAPHAG